MGPGATYLFRLVTGSVLVLAGTTIGHELGHALVDYRDGYRGKWEISVGPRSWRDGSLGHYYVDDGATSSVERHHDELNPATVFFGAGGAILSTIWARKALHKT